MKVVLVIPSFPKLSESFIVSKFLGLLERGWDVYVVCGKSEPSEWSNFPELAKCKQARTRVKVSWPHRPRWLAALLMPFAVLVSLAGNPVGSWRYLCRGGKQFGWSVWRRFYLDANMVALKPDVIHFEFGSLAVDRMHLKPLLGSKLIVSFRGYDLNFSGLDSRDYFREVWEQADALHLLGDGLWQGAQQRGCPPNKPHVLIPPAIDTKFFDPGEREETEAPLDRPLKILSVGRLTWEKGLEYAVEAIHLLANWGIQAELRIIGDGVMLESLAFARHKLGVEKAVQFLGGLPRANVRQEMLAADVFLHASVSEGFCNAVIEAQAMGLPIVCSDAGGLPENVADGETGFVVPRRSAEALAEKLAVLARDSGLRQRMGEGGRRRVLERFQMSDQIEAFDRLYHSVLSSGPQITKNRLGRQGVGESLSKLPNET